jgi:hypothetical protein
MPTVPTLSLAPNVQTLLQGSRTLLVVAPAGTFAPDAFPQLLAKELQTLVLELARDTKPGDLGAISSTLTGVAEPRRLTLGVLPDAGSRHNSPARALVDTPPSELDPEAFAARARDLVGDLEGVHVEEIVGDELKERGLDGIHAVGGQSRHQGAPPVGRHLHAAQPSGKHVALVGKGVTFDTGGLHLKAAGHDGDR